VFGLPSGKGVTPDSLMKRAFGAAGKSVKMEGVKLVIIRMEDGTERTIIPFQVNDQQAPGWRGLNIAVKEWYENGEYIDSGQASV
jgi:hypothetical protein